MDDNVLYEIYFDGLLKKHQDPAKVKSRLCSLFKKSPEAIEGIFSQAPIVIQKYRSVQKAQQYKAVFDQTGAVCRIVPDPEHEQMMMFPDKSSNIEPTLKKKNDKIPSIYSPEKHTSAKEKEMIENAPAVQAVNRETWLYLGVGSVIAIIVLLFPFLSFIFRYIITLVHELGHALFAWTFGYPAIPAFDFTYGGGVTMWSKKHTIIILFVYALFMFLLYYYRKNVITLLILILITVFYTVAVFTKLHDIIILFMGHGTELIFASIFFYRALSGSSVIVDAERPLYAFLSFFIYFNDIRFAHRLMHSDLYRAQYGAAKGGGHWMDFDRLANDYLNTKLTTVATFFLILCMIAPVLTFLFYRYKAYIFNIFPILLDANLNKNKK